MVCDADYGEFGVGGGSGGSPCTDVTPFGFAGEYTDSSGLIYLRARWYDPVSGQFLSVDPLVDVTRDAYGYAGGNPLQFTDPLGLDWLDAVGEWTAAFGDTVTFGGTEQIRRLISYSMGDGDRDLISHCTVFYEWGGHGGDIANVGLAFVGGVGAVQSALRGLEQSVALYSPFEAGLSTAQSALRAEPAVASVATEVVGEASAALRSATRTGLGAADGADWANASGILRDSSAGKGNFGVGAGTVADAESAGAAWVGEDARLASDGYGWVSRDGLRQWRPPSYKPERGIWQSNFESKWPGISGWQANGHLDIVDLP